MLEQSDRDHATAVGSTDRLTGPFDAVVDALSLGVPSQMRETEWAAGYGVLGTEFESGDLLALRRFPHGTLGSYTTVWHCSPDGIWRMYFDAAQQDLACPRYFSNALFDSERASIDLEWRTAKTLEVRAFRRHLVDIHWRVTLGASAKTTILNAVSRLMPPRLTTSPAFLNAMARGADVLLDMGGFAATGDAPNGQQFMLRPKWMAPVTYAQAQIDGVDLGPMLKSGRTRRLGDFVIPRRPLFAVGWASFETDGLPSPAEVPVAVDDEDQLLSKYVCQRLVSRVVEASHRGTFGGERTFAAVMFIDIHGFTALAERCEPERVMRILNRNLEIVVDTIFRYDGAVLKFLGDGVLAAFGVHRQRGDDVQRAAMAALEIQANIAAAQAHAGADERVSVAIGLHCGDVVCGNIGHRDRLDFTIIGDTVNVAQRIESHASGAETLVSQDVARLLENDFAFEDGHPVSVKGRSEAVEIHRLVAAS
jgi:class 3 adenylate cyclase